MTVTSVRAVGSDGVRVRISLDRSPAGQLDRERASALGIQRGAVLTSEIVAPLIAALDETAALKRALRLINTRDRSTGELRDRLRRAAHQPAAIDAVVTQFVASGLLDDERLADRLATGLAARGSAGRRLVEAKLAQRGIARDIAGHAAAQATEDRDPLADAKALVGKRAGSMLGRLEPHVVRRRLAAYLARRGFEAEIARQAVDAALQSNGHADELN